MTRSQPVAITVEQRKIRWPRPANDLIIDLQERLHVTSVTITHDMISAYKIADKIAMLYQGRIEAVGTPEEIQNSDNPVIQQFIHGRAEGPITNK